MSQPHAAVDQTGVLIEPATEDDRAAIVDILNYMTAHSHASFSTRPTTVAAQRGWFEQSGTTGPYRLLVARRGSLLLGYASSRRYREHEAFRETVEVSVGLEVGSRGQGVGTLLYRALFDCLADEPVHTVVAGIALPNDASVALHRKFGFTDVGVFREYAIKDGEYISSLWMQRLSPPARGDR